MLKPELFFVATAVRPSLNHPARARTPWALVTVWLLAGSQADALTRTREFFEMENCQYVLATRKCLVNPASLYKGAIPAAATDFPVPNAIVAIEDPASEDSALPNFERIFGEDSLLTLTL